VKAFNIPLCVLNTVQHSQLDPQQNVQMSEFTIYTSQFVQTPISKKTRVTDSYEHNMSHKTVPRGSIVAISFSSESVCYMRRGSTKHPIWETYGLAITAFAAWRVDISHTW